MKKLATALSIGAFSPVFSQGVNISKFHRAYIAQDENNVAFLVKAPDDEPSKMQAKIKAIKAKENVAPFSSSTFTRNRKTKFRTKQTRFYRCCKC